MNASLGSLVKSTQTHSTRRGLLRAGLAGAIGAGLLEAFPLHAAEKPSEEKIKAFDRMMHSFMELHQPPGASLAVSRQGKLVYSRGFGLADQDAKSPVTEASLFRIASLSKPITAVAVLQLVQRGKLKLSDRVADLLDLKDLADKRWRAITIEHLLQHRAGFDRGKSSDPMFMSVKIARALDEKPPATPEQIIRYMVGRELDFTPGEKYAYSNFGYCLLGRAIERLSGTPYEKYVRDEVLAPLKITRMKLGRTLLAHRAKDEVRYYVSKEPTAPAVMGKIGDQVPLPYGAWCLEAMDAHGGWLAAAADLAMFAGAFADRLRPKLLTAELVSRMWQCPAGPAWRDAAGKPKDFFYGCGWQVRPVGKTGECNAWHNGSLDGTSTLMVRRFDGLAWAVLFNRRDGSEGGPLASAIDSLIHPVADSVWPTQ